MYDDVYLNDLGYYTIKNPPSKDYLESFYRDSYHRRGRKVVFSAEEMAFREAKLEQKLLLIKNHGGKGRRFLDIGCGKGFTLVFFLNKGYDVLGLDYSTSGIESNFPELLDRLIDGDLYETMESLADDGKTFDVINMDNVLEHVLDPLELAKRLRPLLCENGVVIVTVPNDFSVMQRYMWENGVVEKPLWIATPDHISYFNKESLIALFEAAGLSLVDLLGESLIEFSALNEMTNYFKDRSVGKACHRARIKQEALFHSISPEKTLELFRIYGEMGLGRQVTGVFK